MIGKSRARITRVVTTTARPKGPIAARGPKPANALLRVSMSNPIG